MRWIFLFLGLGVSALAVTDSVTIYEQGGTTTTNYPIQIGRPFVDGEIANCPQPVIGGTPATNWQADVKQTYSDGSVKHAIVAFLIPTLTANSSVNISFQNAACSNTPLTLVQMQAGGYNFNAQIKLTNGSTITADALTMLNAGKYTLWTSGQVAQTVLIADDAQETTCGGTACSAYDMGFDSHKVIRPRFYATFWPTINKVSVRIVAEISNSEAVEDQTYSADLYYGNTSPTEVCDWGTSYTACTSASFLHNALSRWVKGPYWIGGKPSLVAIDHNLAYLTSTGAIPNFDTTKGTGVASHEAANWSAWNSVSHDPFWTVNNPAQGCMNSSATQAAQWPHSSFQGGYCGAFWQAQEGPPGGDRPDLGPYTGWVMN